jgi:hypothetical protein
MVQTYQPKNVPEVIAAKTGEFWSKTKIDDYYNHFHELLDEPISMKGNASLYLQPRARL